jgi:hypothetical protein
LDLRDMQRGEDQQWLPDELMPLAEQLACDADYLEKQFPCAGAPGVSRSERSTSVSHDSAVGSEVWAHGFSSGSSNEASAVGMPADGPLSGHAGSGDHFGSGDDVGSGARASSGTHVVAANLPGPRSAPLLKRRITRFSAAAALLLTTGVLSWVGWSAGEIPRLSPQAGQPVVLPTEGPTFPVRFGPAQHGVGNPSGGHVRPAIDFTPIYLPAGSFETLSAPEQEGLLDLLEEDAQAVIRLSI